MTGPQTAPDMDDQTLIASAQRGDHQAFGELVCRYQQSLFGLIYRMYGDARLAEDAAQEAFVRTWQNIEKYNPQYAFRSWLYRIGVNAATDSLRRERPADEIESLPLRDQNPTPEQVAETDQRAALVRRAVAHLSEPLRLVLVLREYEELSYQEIAATLDVPIGTVMSRLNTARTQLRRELIGLLEAQ
jgi:RNA polymerase sigma-70 factor (ECF subfamily)